MIIIVTHYKYNSKTCCDKIKKHYSLAYCVQYRTFAALKKKRLNRSMNILKTTSQKSELQQLYKLSIPLILTQLGQVIVAVADNAMVGQVNAQYLAAAAFANSIFVLIMFFGMGITLGITPLVGKHNGANEHDAIASILSNAFFTKIVITILLMLLSVGIYFCMPLMGQAEEVVQYASSYFILLILSLIPLLFFFVFKQFAEGLGDTKLAMRITIVGNLLNIVLNYIFIFGKFGVPQMNLDGAGWATLISRITMLGMMLWSCRHRPLLRPWLQSISLKKYSFAESKKLLHIGVPISLQMTAEASIFSLSGIMVGWLGAVSLAAYQIVTTISYCSFMIITGFAQAVTIHVSTLLGAKAFDRVRTSIISAAKVTFILMTGLSIIFIVFRFQFTHFFTTDSEVLAIASKLMILLVFYQLSDGFQVLGMGILRAFTDVKHPMVVAVISYFIIALPGGYLLGFVFDFGITGVWMGLVIGLSLAAVFFGIRVTKNMKTLHEKTK